MEGRPEGKWWQKGIIYEAYLPSFMDSSGDGMGDLKGLLSKLPYLEWLGVDILWVTPIYPSPMKDFGYDVTSYTEVGPLYGSMEEFEELLREVHRLGIKLILDFVPNHTSVEHPWFKDKRDWYVWKDAGPQGGPPNGWRSDFGRSAWTLDSRTGQYYFHSFLEQQADLNWRNKELQKVMLENLRFWLDKGVDGFRMDALWHLLEDFSEGQGVSIDLDLEGTLGIAKKMRGVLDLYGERMMTGEIHLPIPELVKFYGSEEERALQLPRNFHLIDLKWIPEAIAACIDEFDRALPSFAWPSWILGNHDVPRLVSRLGEGQARVAAMLLLTLRGTPTIYQGDELGMSDGNIPDGEERDPVGKLLPGQGRDPERTPMPWNGGGKGGFTQGGPWLPLNEDTPQVNVERERKDPSSVLSLYRELIHLRQAHPALHSGSYQQVYVRDSLFSYRRECGEESYLIILNFSGEEKHWKDERLTGKVVLSTVSRKRERLRGEARLAPHEGMILFDRKGVSKGGHDGQVSKHRE